MGYPTRTDSKPTPQQRAQNERTQALTGLQGQDNSKKAVLVSDAAKVGSVSLLSAKVTAAPTAAEHNALVDDVRALALALNAMGAKFTGF